MARVIFCHLYYIAGRDSMCRRDSISPGVTPCVKVFSLSAGMITASTLRFATVLLALHGCSACCSACGCSSASCSSCGASCAGVADEAIGQPGRTAVAGGLCSAISFQYCNVSCGSWVERMEGSCSSCGACSACGGDDTLVKDCQENMLYSPTYVVPPRCESIALLDYLSALNVSIQRTAESLCLRPELNVSSAAEDLVISMNGW